LTPNAFRVERCFAFPQHDQHEIFTFRNLAAVILPASFALAQQTSQSLANAELPSLVAIYKDLHTHPELSTHEERSAAIVAKELKAADCISPSMLANTTNRV
jgi:hypothetical protein